MSVLVLRLAAPLQSWGVDSRFVRRTTGPAPSKSGLIGLLAAAKGLRRTDPLEDLLELRMAVRLDQPGELIRDFHTAHHPRRGSMPLSERFYWADAVFTAYLEGSDQLIEGISQQLRNPAFPLYLGRRSCVPSGRLVLGVTEDSVPQAVRQTPWQASRFKRKRTRAESVTVLVEADADLFPELPVTRQVRDVPLSFDPVRREYGLRAVAETTVELPNPEVRNEAGDRFFSPVLEAQ